MLFKSLFYYVNSFFIFYLSFYIFRKFFEFFGYRIKNTVINKKHGKIKPIIFLKKLCLSEEHNQVFFDLQIIGIHLNNIYSTNKTVL